MSRADRAARRAQSPRGRKFLTFKKADGFTVDRAFGWWDRKRADVIEARREGRAPAPPVPVQETVELEAPRMIERPEDMTRQVQRRNYREACKIGRKIAGLPRKAAR